MNANRDFGSVSFHSILLDRRAIIPKSYNLVGFFLQIISFCDFQNVLFIKICQCKMVFLLVRVYHPDFLL